MTEAWGLGTAGTRLETAKYITKLKRDLIKILGKISLTFKLSREIFIYRLESFVSCRAANTN